MYVSNIWWERVFDIIVIGQSKCQSEYDIVIRKKSKSLTTILVVFLKLIREASDLLKLIWTFFVVNCRLRFPPHSGSYFISRFENQAKIIDPKVSHKYMVWEFKDSLD